MLEMRVAQSAIFFYRALFVTFFSVHAREKIDFFIGVLHV